MEKTATARAPKTTKTAQRMLAKNYRKTCKRYRNPVEKQYQIAQNASCGPRTARGPLKSAQISFQTDFLWPTPRPWTEGKRPSRGAGEQQALPRRAERAPRARLPLKQAPDSIYMRPRGALGEGKVANRTVHPSKIKG